MKQVVPSANFVWCYARVIMWVDSMMTEHMNQTSKLCGIWAQTSKLSEDSVTMLVGNGCLNTKERDWRFKLTQIFLIYGTLKNEFVAVRCSVACGMWRNKGLYSVLRLELNGLEWSGGCVECGCRDNASSGSSGHIENALPAESNDRDANSTNWEV